MRGLRTGPLADRDPQNISDPQTDCRSFTDEKLHTQILTLDRLLFIIIIKYFEIILVVL